MYCCFPPELTLFKGLYCMVFSYQAHWFSGKHEINSSSNVILSCNSIAKCCFSEHACEAAHPIFNSSGHLIWLSSFPFWIAVDGLEKASLANSDAVVADAQTPQLKQRAKLSSLGKIFKPWKWRKKKTSDKFQDLSKGRREHEAHLLQFVAVGQNIINTIQWTSLGCRQSLPI